MTYAKRLDATHECIRAAIVSIEALHFGAAMLEMTIAAVHLRYLATDKAMAEVVQFCARHAAARTVEGDG